MKSIIYPNLLILLCACLYSSCRKTAERNILVEFDSLKLNKTYHLFNDSLKPGCNIEANFIYPSKCSDDTLLNKIQSLFIAKFFSDDFQYMTPEQAIASYAEQYIAEFKRFETETVIEDNYPEEEEDVRNKHSLFFSRLNNSIEFNENNVLSFIVRYVNYAGSQTSHGLYAYVIDLNTGLLVNEDQIFKDNIQKQISRLIVEKIKKQNGLKNEGQLEDLGYNSTDEILPNGNFILNNKGITYFFNEDEIAPYFVGQTTVFLPYKEIDIYLDENSPVTELWN